MHTRVHLRHMRMYIVCIYTYVRTWNAHTCDAPIKRHSWKRYGARDVIGSSIMRSVWLCPSARFIYQRVYYNHELWIMSCTLFFGRQNAERNRHIIVNVPGVALDECNTPAVPSRFHRYITANWVSTAPVSSSYVRSAESASRNSTVDWWLKSSRFAT